MSFTFLGLRSEKYPTHSLTHTGNASCAESPFGGIKQSGYGKEAGKDVAIEEYLISKTGTLTVGDAL